MPKTENRRKSKKPAMEMTRDELARRVFPKKVIAEAKRIAVAASSRHEKLLSDTVFGTREQS